MGSVFAFPQPELVLLPLPRAPAYTVSCPPLTTVPSEPCRPHTPRVPCARSALDGTWWDVGDSKQGRVSVGAPVPVWEPHQRWAMCHHHLPALRGTCPEEGGGASVVGRPQWWATGPLSVPLGQHLGRDSSAPRALQWPLI